MSLYGLHSNTFLLGKFCSNAWQCSYRIILFLVRLTPYDIISIFVCGIISALGLIGVPILWLILAAYLLFGLLWIVSAFLPIP